MVSEFDRNSDQLKLDGLLGHNLENKGLRNDGEDGLVRAAVGEDVVEVPSILAVK